MSTLSLWKGVAVKWFRHLFYEAEQAVFALHPAPASLDRKGWTPERKHPPQTPWTTAPWFLLNTCTKKGAYLIHTIHLTLELC